jgi:hypothetical protein
VRERRNVWKIPRKGIDDHQAHHQGAGKHAGWRQQQRLNPTSVSSGLFGKASLLFRAKASVEMMGRSNSRNSTAIMLDKPAIYSALRIPNGETRPF